MSNSIFTLLPKIAADIGAVGKGQTNKDQGYKYRGIDDLLNAAHRALVQHGVTIIPRVVSRELRPGQTKSGTPNLWVGLTVEYVFWAADGSNVMTTVMSEGIDTSDKATNKALSAALKYALIQVFSVPTADMDDSDRTSPEQSAKPAPKPTALDQARQWGLDNAAKIESLGLTAEWVAAIEGAKLDTLRKIKAQVMA